MTDAVHARVVTFLERELSAINELHYRHHVCLLLLGIGDATYLGVALDDLTAAEDELAQIDLLRAAAVAELGARWDLDPTSVRLSDLIDRADETTRPPLEQLAARLRAATEELAHTRATAMVLAAEHASELDRRRAAVEAGPATTYDRSGRGQRRGGAAVSQVRS